MSGNVSLYNETLGQAILPTPTIGGVGLIDDRSKTATIGGWQEGDVLFLVGQDGTHLGSSIFLREIAGREDGGAPVVDLGAERRHGDAVRGLIRSGRVSACHDLSDGGLAVALAEMCIASNLGAKVAPGDGARHALLFGEDQARYVLAVPAGEAEPSQASWPPCRIAASARSAGASFRSTACCRWPCPT